MLFSPEVIAQGVDPKEDARSKYKRNMNVHVRTKAEKNSAHPSTIAVTHLLDLLGDFAPNVNSDTMQDGSDPNTKKMNTPLATRVGKTSNGSASVPARSGEPKVSSG